MEYLYGLNSIIDTSLELSGNRMIASLKKIKDSYIKSLAVLKIDEIYGKDKNGNSGYDF